MTDPMEDLIEQIKKTIRKLRNGISKQDRDDLEFDLNDFNINISGMEYDWDCRCIDLDEAKDKEYKEKKDEIKVDAQMKRHLDSTFLKDQTALDRIEATLKRYKKLHAGFIRIAEHIKSNVIGENVDKKRDGF